MPKDKVLENFMKEFFPYGQFKKIGFFTPEMKGDYEAQAKKVCHFFGYKTVYEYGSKEMRGHITFSGDRPLSINNNGELEPEPFITVFPSIYE
jgi:hypothetical protein